MERLTKIIVCSLIGIGFASGVFITIDYLYLWIKTPSILPHYSLYSYILNTYDSKKAFETNIFIMAFCFYMLFDNIKSITKEIIRK